MNEPNADTARVAANIEAILTAKDADGDWVYTQTEVRDFIAACVFLLDVPVTPQLEGALHKFMGQFDFDESASDDDVIQAIAKYFEDHPLNENILKEMGEFGRKELTGNRDDFDEEEVTGRVADARRAAGLSDSSRAPTSETSGRSQAPAPKKGLT